MAYVLFLLAGFVRSCSRKSPNEDDCFQKMFQGIFPFIAPGIPEYGIASFEPLTIDKISVSRNNGQVITLNGSFNNLNIRGPSNATVKRANLDFEKETLDFDLEIPKLRINATYNLKGNILLLPIVGAGAVNIMLKDIKTSVSTKISLQNLPEVRILEFFNELINKLTQTFTLFFRKPSELSK